MEIILQNRIDALVESVRNTGHLIKDEHITGRIFQIIENTKSIKIEYDNLCILYDKHSLNKNIGKRVREYFDLIAGEKTSAKSKTSLVEKYTLLYNREEK